MIIKPQTEKLTIEPALKRMLKVLFPWMDQSIFSFHKGLPWYIPENAASAITLPADLSREKVDVYFSNYDSESPGGLSLIVHECIHVCQYQQIRTFTGFQLIRPFILYYLGAWMRYGYYRHPFELPAYKGQARFEMIFASFRESFSSHRGVTPEMLDAFTDHLERNEVVFKQSDMLPETLGLAWMIPGLMIAIPANLLKVLGDLVHYPLQRLRR